MGAVGSIIGQGVGAQISGAGAYKESKETQWALEDEARIHERNADIARRTGAFNAQRQQIIGVQREGEISAGYASAGISQDSVSAIEVLRMSAINNEMDRQNILHGAELDAINSEHQAYYAKHGAERERKARPFKVFSSVFGSFMGSGGASNFPSGSGAQGKSGGSGMLGSSGGDSGGASGPSFMSNF